MKNIASIMLTLAVSGLGLSVLAEEEFAPYGTATLSKTQYSPQKLAISVMGTPEETRGLLQQLVQVLKQYPAGAPKGSQIEVVVVGATVGAFAKENYTSFQSQIDEIAEMTKGAEPVKVTLCGNSIKNVGYKYEDMHGFADVATLGYAELAHLAQNGFVILPITIVKAKDARYFFRPDKKPQAPTTALPPGKM